VRSVLFCLAALLLSATAFADPLGDSAAALAAIAVVRSDFLELLSALWVPVVAVVGGFFLIHLFGRAVRLI